jgi:hypothetical protein
VLYVLVAGVSSLRSAAIWRADRRVEQPDPGAGPRRAGHRAGPAGAVRHLADPAAGKALVAFALFVTALVFGVATISNDNLQDLKTGELVGATPWRSRWRWCWAWCSARW